MDKNIFADYLEEQGRRRRIAVTYLCGFDDKHYYVGKGSGYDSCGDGFGWYTFFDIPFNKIGGNSSTFRFYGNGYGDLSFINFDINYV